MTHLQWYVIAHTHTHTQDIHALIRAAIDVQNVWKSSLISQLVNTDSSTSPQYLHALRHAKIKISAHTGPACTFLLYDKVPRFYLVGPLLDVCRAMSERCLPDRVLCSDDIVLCCLSNFEVRDIVMMVVISGHCVLC